MQQHTIELSESAFVGFQERAMAVGLSVSDYLNQIGAARWHADGFVLTPEVRAAIQEGIDQADRGELLTLKQSRAELNTFKAQWRNENIPH